MAQNSRSEKMLQMTEFVHVRIWCSSRYMGLCDKSMKLRLVRPGTTSTEGVVGQFSRVVKGPAFAGSRPTYFEVFLRLFDRPVFFGRDLSRFSDFISVWYGDLPLLRTPSDGCSQFQHITLLCLPTHTHSHRSKSYIL